MNPDGTNPLNADHTFTVTVDRTDGTTPTDAAGVTVNLTWTPGTATGSTIKTVDLPGVIQPGGLTATCVTNASGVCLVTVQDGNVSGTGTLTVNSVVGDLIGVGARAETPIPGSDLTGSKTWVDHRVFVTETDTNAVGQPHTFSVIAQINNGGGWVNLTAGTVDLTWDPGTATGSAITAVATGTFTPTTASCDLAAANPCLVTVNSLTDFGTGTLTATTLNATVGVPGNFPVINDGNSASKTWVQVQTAVAATDTNLTGEPHTFTITAQYVDDSGAPDALPVPDGTVVNFTFTGTGTVTHVNGAPAPGATSCVTTAGACTVTVSSNTPGSGVITVTGIESVVIDGDELAPGAAVLSATTIPLGSQTATKTWARYAVDVSPDAVNLLGDDHVFIISVTRDAGAGPMPAMGVTVNYSWVGPGGSTASPTTSCVTVAGGTCTVTVDSNTTTGGGTLTITSLGTAEGSISLTYANSTTDVPNPENGLDAATSDGRGVKSWWAYDVDISGNDANLAGQSHTFTVTATVDKGLGPIPVADGVRRHGDAQQRQRRWCHRRYRRRPRSDHLPREPTRTGYGRGHGRRLLHDRGRRHPAGRDHGDADVARRRRLHRQPHAGRRRSGDHARAAGRGDEVLGAVPPWGHAERRREPTHCRARLHHQGRDLDQRNHVGSCRRRNAGRLRLGRSRWLNHRAGGHLHDRRRCRRVPGDGRLRHQPRPRHADGDGHPQLVGRHARWHARRPRRRSQRWQCARPGARVRPRRNEDVGGLQGDHHRRRSQPARCRARLHCHALQDDRRRALRRGRRPDRRHDAGVRPDRVDGRQRREPRTGVER